jgi:hypothetical protein
MNQDILNPIAENGSLAYSKEIQVQCGLTWPSPLLLAHVFSLRDGQVQVDTSNVNIITDAYDDGARAKVQSREGKS